jgi:hypothetical protein
MKLNIYTIFDSKAAAFIPPFFVQNDHVAIRAFADGANSPDHQFCRFSADFSLHNIGIFDDCTGEIEMHITPKNLGFAASFKTLSSEVQS